MDLGKPCRACLWWQCNRSCGWFRLAVGTSSKLRRRPSTRTGAPRRTWLWPKSFAKRERKERSFENAAQWKRKKKEGYIIEMTLYIVLFGFKSGGDFRGFYTIQFLKPLTSIFFFIKIKNKKLISHPKINETLIFIGFVRGNY